MSLNACAECKGQVSSSAASCPHCGHPTGTRWGSCPECKGAIGPEQTSCSTCGFPLKPSSNPVAPLPRAPMRKKMRRFGGGRGNRVLEESQEPAGAIVFAVLGLFVPILALIGLGLSKRGSGAYILSWVAIGLWILSVALIFGRYHS